MVFVILLNLGSLSLIVRMLIFEQAIIGVIMFVCVSVSITSSSISIILLATIYKLDIVLLSKTSHNIAFRIPTFFLLKKKLPLRVFEIWPIAGICRTCLVIQIHITAIFSIINQRLIILISFLSAFRI